jgi:hypothetical protein
MVLLDWPPPHHLWIGPKSREFLRISAIDQRPRKHAC